MRNPIKITAAALTASLLLGAVAPSWAASIGVNFLGRGATSSLNATDVAGVVPQSQWYNFNTGDPVVQNGSSLPLLDNTGAFTAVKLVYSASDSWNSDGPTVTPDDILMKGVIKCNPSNDGTNVITDGTDRMIFTITNLPAGTFNVIVYLTSNGTNAQVSVSAGATTYYVSEENSFSGTFSRILNTISTTPYPIGGNYAQFDAVASVGGAITVTIIKFLEQPQNNDGAGVPAIQIVQLTGSPFPPNTTPSSITTPPASTAVVVGNTATFNVVAGGPGPSKIQWQKYGTNIVGATGTSYTTPATVLGDNGTPYRVLVYNNVITNTSPDAILTVASPVLTQGFMTVQRWDGVTGVALTDALTAIAGGPPTTSYFVAGASQPDAGLDNFGSTMSGWVVPTVSGNYDFFLRSDDQSGLYLNEIAAVSGTNSLPDVLTATPIALEFTANQPFAEPGANPRTTAAPIPLVAGKLYGMVAVLKEGTGGDMVQVAWRLTTDTTPAAQLKPIAPGNTWTLATPLGQTANITTQPSSQTVQETRPVTFKAAVATTPTAGLYGIQWLKNGIEITGANGASYTIASTTTNQSGELYSARFYTLAGVTNSTAALLTVIPDTFPPVATAAAITQTLPGGGSAIQVGVTFDEPVNPAGLVAGNFTLNGGTGTFSLATNIIGTYKGVLLNTTGLVPGGSYTVNVKNIADLKGNVIATTNVPFTVGKIAWADVGVPPRPSQVIPVGTDGFDILNGGRTEWATYDEVALVYVKKTNDFDVKLQVIYAEPSSQWGRVGLQARNALNAGDPPDSGVVNPEIGTNQSAYAQTHVNPNQSLAGSGVWPAADPIQPGNANANNGHEQNCRLDTGIATSGWGSPATVPVYPNVWLRLRRVGAVITGFRSEDGIVWINQGDVTLTAQTNVMHVGPSLSAETGNIGWVGFNVYTDPFDPVHAGLFLAQFRNFGDLSVPVPPSNLTITKVGANVVLSWTAGVLQSASVLANPTVFTDVTGVTGTSYTVAPSGTKTYYRLRGTQ